MLLSEGMVWVLRHGDVTREYRNKSWGGEKMMSSNQQKEFEVLIRLEIQGSSRPLISRGEERRGLEVEIRTSFEMPVVVKIMGFQEFVQQQVGVSHRVIS